MEVKRPLPQIPAPVWGEFKDLQEWEKYHQSRSQDDKTSNALAAIADAIHHMPGGWIVTTSTDKIFNWARRSAPLGNGRPSRRRFVGGGTAKRRRPVPVSRRCRTRWEP